MNRHPFRNYYDRCTHLVILSDRLGETDPSASKYDALRQRYWEIENTFYKQYLSTHVLPSLIKKDLIIKGEKYEFTWFMDNSVGRCEITFQKVY